MASVVSIEDDELTCSICLEVFIDPRILPCAHSFCFSCLQGWTSDTPEEITCPLCKHGSPVPTGGLKQLKSNFFVADLVKRMTKRSEEFCSKHPKQICHMYCRDCELAACSKCLSMNHKRHHLVDLTEEIQLGLYPRRQNPHRQDPFKQLQQLTSDRGPLCSPTAHLPKGPWHWSVCQLVRRPTGPTAHWCEGPLVQRPIGPKPHWSKGPWHWSQNEFKLI